jgi:hypothetical protein
MRKAGLTAGLEPLQAAVAQRTTTRVPTRTRL